jgi:hypothetical protein
MRSVSVPRWLELEINDVLFGSRHDLAHHARRGLEESETTAACLRAIEEAIHFRM